MYNIKDRLAQEEIDREMQEKTRKFKTMKIQENDQEQEDSTQEMNREGIYSFQPNYASMKEIKLESDKQLKEDMKEMAERYVVQHKEQKETEVHKQYLLEMLKIQKGTEPPVYQKQEVNFRLQNPFEGKFKQIKK